MNSADRKRWDDLADVLRDEMGDAEGRVLRELAKGPAAAAEQLELEANDDRPTGLGVRTPQPPGRGPVVDADPAGYVRLLVPVGRSTFATDDRFVYFAVSVEPATAVEVLRAWSTVCEGEGWDDEAQAALIDVLFPLLEALLGGIGFLEA